MSLLSMVPYAIIGGMLRKKRSLTVEEGNAMVAYREKLHAGLPIYGKDNPVIIGMVGAVGSGKSTVAQSLARRIGGIVVSGDDIRLELKKYGAGYDRTWAIAETLAIATINRGASVIIDSDFVDERKRISLKEKMEINGYSVLRGVGLYFIRTKCEITVMIQRMRQNDPGEFFNTSFMEPDTGKGVKLFEFVRRMPLHYKWKNKGGGEWKLRQFSWVSATVDTTTDMEEECEGKFYLSDRTVHALHTKGVLLKT